MSAATASAPLLDYALAAYEAGLCVFPPKEDGTKAPDADSWTRYQTTRSTREEIERWYVDGRRSGLGYITGAVSGRLELLDFDDVESYESFKALATAAGLADLVERIEAGYLEASPAGRHWLYRCEHIEGNTKLARRPKRPEEMEHEKDKIKVEIETRGEGGFTIAAPSNGRVHPSGKPYRQLRGGVDTILTITPEERNELFAAARALDEMPKDEARSFAGGGDKPGNDYNARGDVRSLLERHGWRVVFERNGVTHWRRPGKDRGTSATFATVNGKRYFYPFTTSTVFDAERAYSPFALYATLEHEGDFSAAAKDLADQGFGEPAARINTDERDRARDHAAKEASAAIHAPAFPVDVLPPNGVRAYIVDAAASLNAPPEMIAVPMLGMAGSVIGNRAHLILKNSYREYPTLYLAIVAPPGSAKTPGLNLAQWPLDALQHDAEQVYRERLERYEDDLEAWRQSKEYDKPTKPRLRDYFSSNLTLEALIGMFDRAPGVAIIRDEILGWVLSMDQYRAGKGSDRQEYLSLWSAKTIKLDRKGGQAVYRRYPVACVVGGIQPDLVGGLHNEAQKRDGFVERLLPIVPATKPMPWTEETISTERYADVLSVFQRLDKLPAADFTCGDGNAVGIGVNLSTEARRLYVSWFNENAALVAGAEGLAAGFYSKLPAHVARFALILHALWNPDDPRIMVSADRMEDAIELGEFFRAHIGRFLALLKATAPDCSAGLHARIMRIMRNANQDQEGQWTSRSEVYRKLRNVTPEALTAALNALVDAEKIDRRIDAGTTKPVEQYRIRISHYSHYPGSQPSQTAESDSEAGENANNANNANGVESEVLRVATMLQTFTAEDLAGFRREVAEARDDDPDVALDREALALLDVMHAAGDAP